MHPATHRMPVNIIVNIFGILCTVFASFSVFLHHTIVNVNATTNIVNDIPKIFLPTTGIHIVEFIIISN